MVKEVIEPHARERVADQETLCRLPRPEEEVGLFPDQPREIESALDDSFRCHPCRQRSCQMTTQASIARLLCSDTTVWRGRRLLRWHGPSHRPAYRLHRKKVS